MSSCLLPPILWPHLSGMVRLRFLFPCKTSGQNSRGKDPQETEVVSTIGMEYHPNNQASNRSTSITSSQVKSNQVKPITSINEPNNHTTNPLQPSSTLPTLLYTSQATTREGDYPGAFDSRWRTVLISSSKVSGRRILGSRGQLKWIWLWRGWDEKHQLLIAIYKIYKLVLKVDDGFLT